MRKANQPIVVVAGQTGALTRLLEALRGRLPASPLHLMGAAASLAVIAVAAIVLEKTFSNLSLFEIGAALTETSAKQIAAAALFAALSYLALTGYDFAALRLIGAKTSARAALLASFASCAISFTLGFPLVTAPALRFWVYSREGLSAAQILKITLITGVTFWLGMIAVLGAGLAAGAGALTAVDGLPASINALLGAAVLAALGYYCFWSSRGPRRISLRGHFFELPGPGPAAAQIALGAVDVCCAGAALFVLLPEGQAADFAGFIAAYVFACLLGVVSHAPGGVGVFEAAMLHALPSAAPESLVAALLLFRVIYYLAPFVLALVLLWADDSARRRAP